MTENEALKLMESLQISKDCELVKTLDFKATVIKALEKQIPKKPIGVCKVDGDFRVGICSICNDIVDSKQNYCDRCGHKLDWEGGE